MLMLGVNAKVNAQTGAGPILSLGISIVGGHQLSVCMNEQKYHAAKRPASMSTSLPTNRRAIPLMFLASICVFVPRVQCGWGQCFQ